jgi:hypothetical protein
MLLPLEVLHTVIVVEKSLFHSQRRSRELCSQHDELGLSFGGLNMKRSGSGDSHKLSSERVLPLRYNLARDTAGLWVRAGFVERISAKGRNLIHKGVFSATRVHELTLDPPRLVIIHEAHDLDGKFHV